MATLRNSIAVRAFAFLHAELGCTATIQFMIPMAKQNKTKNTLWFVSHPYASPPKGDLVGNLCLWNRSSPHHRKLLESLQATIIDCNNQVLSQQEITFIGEWECCSSFVPSGQKAPFNLIHTPIHSRHDALITKCLNTDPYVFGNEFKWICCKQPKDKNKLNTGDIVIFGSYTLTNRKVDKMLIDTVLVVDKVIEPANFNPKNFSKCYNDVTIVHTDRPFHIVLGKMYDTTKSYEENVPFSFVPCRRAANGLMDKQVLDRHIPIKELAGEPLRIGQNGGHLDIDENIDAWRSIVNVVRATGCELGVFIPEPSLTASNSIIDKATKAIFLNNRQNEKETNASCSGDCRRTLG